MTPVLAVSAGLLLARLGAFAVAMPLFGTNTPHLVRMGFVVALAMFYISAAPPTVAPNPLGAQMEIETFRYVLAVTREGLIGAAMGFAFGLFLLPARIAGGFVTQQIGLNTVPELNLTSGESAGPITTAFETTAGLVFLLADGHHIVLSALHASFATFQLGGTTVPEAGPMVTGLATAYEMGLLLAAPLGLCLFLLSVTLAVMARTAPQLNVYSVGFSLQVIVLLFGGLFLLPEMVLTLNAIVARVGGMLQGLV